MSGGLDLRRLAELEARLGVGRAEIAATLLGEMTDSLTAASDALATGDFAAAAGAVHAAH